MRYLAEITSHRIVVVAVHGHCQILKVLIRFYLLVDNMAYCAVGFNGFSKFSVLWKIYNYLAMRSCLLLVRYFQLSTQLLILELDLWLSNWLCLHWSIFSFHPSLAMLTTTSGKRVFSLDMSDSEDSGNEDVIRADNSIRLWWIGEWNNLESFGWCVEVVFTFQWSCAWLVSV